MTSSRKHVFVAGAYTEEEQCRMLLEIEPEFMGALRYFLSDRARELAAIFSRGGACPNKVTDAELKNFARTAQLTSLALQQYDAIWY